MREFSSHGGLFPPVFTAIPPPSLLLSSSPPFSLLVYGGSWLMPPSETRHHVIGLRLLQLLVANKLADFHSEVEGLSDEDRQHPSIKFSLELEAFLMEGSYNRVRHLYSLCFAWHDFNAPSSTPLLSSLLE